MLGFDFVRFFICFVVIFVLTFFLCVDFLGLSCFFFLPFMFVFGDTAVGSGFSFFFLNIVFYVVAIISWLYDFECWSNIECCFKGKPFETRGIFTTVKDIRLFSTQ